MITTTSTSETRRPGVANESLAELLDRHTVAGQLCQPEGDKLRCVACGHRCLIAPGRRGICKVRRNENGLLRVPFGYVCGLQCDPVEKKPFFHVLPGSDAVTFGMLGCDFHCAYCQNWVTSQALRDPAATAPVKVVTPEQLVATALQQRARLMVSSYNEPLITAEWSRAIFEKARPAGLLTAFVSNGNATPEALDFIGPHLNAFKIDLKGFDAQRYRTLGGQLEHVLESIKRVHERGLWLEVVTLVIPGFNDGEEEVRRIARFIAGISRDIPWHVTAFHQNYKMTDPRNTVADDLVRAAEIGSAEGLRFVYAGNLPGQVGQWEDTRCPRCHRTLVERHGYLIRSYGITTEGRCSGCQYEIPGRWATTDDSQPQGGRGPVFTRRPRSIL